MVVDTIAPTKVYHHYPQLFLDPITAGVSQLCLVKLRLGALI